MIALEILKITGIILLTLLGIVLAVILLVLFCPLFYHAEVRKGDEFGGRIVVSWFFHIITLSLEYPAKRKVVLKLFGFPVSTHKAGRKVQKKEPEKQEISFDADPVVTEQGGEDKTESEKAVSADSDIEKISSKEEKDTAEGKDSTEEGDFTEEGDSTEERDSTEEKEVTGNSQATGCRKKSKTSRWQKLQKKTVRFMQRLWKYLCEIPDKINHLKDSFADKIQKLLDTIDYYERLFDKPGTKKVFAFLKKEVFLLWKHIKPYKSSIRVDYQAVDPRNCGRVMEAYAIFYPFLPADTIVSTSCSEENALRFHVDMKGRFYLFFLGYHALLILRNKKLRRFISLLKREE